MAVRLNHTIVAARDHGASARFLAEILGLSTPAHLGPFAIVQIGDTSLDFVESDGEITSQHYAFLVTELEFDEIFGRIRARGLRTGLIRRVSSAARSMNGMVGAASIGTIRTATCWRSSRVRMAPAAPRRRSRIR